MKIPELQTPEPAVVNTCAKYSQENPKKTADLAVDSIVLQESGKTRRSAVGATSIPLKETHVRLLRPRQSQYCILARLIFPFLNYHGPRFLNTAVDGAGFSRPFALNAANRSVTFAAQYRTQEMNQLNSGPKPAPTLHRHPAP